MPIPLPLKARGSTTNPAGRFEPLQYEPDEEFTDDKPDTTPLRTQCFVDSSKSLIVKNDSPDVPFAYSLNVYRGCEHGCSYCYARTYHEYLGLSAGLDFETKIFVKPNAPELLRQELGQAKWRGEVLGMSGVTDCYQPLEKKFELTRRCLEVMVEFRQPVIIVTKNRLVTRDVDLLAELSRHQAVGVSISITTLDDELSRAMEPRASSPRGRLEAVNALAQAGVPVGVLLAPVIPGLNEHEIPAILEAGRAAGAAFAGYVMLRLPHGLKELFRDWLATHYPNRVERVLGRVRSVRGGRLNSPRFKERMKGTGEWATFLRQIFQLHHTRLDYLPAPMPSSAAFRKPGQRQGMLFGGEDSG